MDKSIFKLRRKYKKNKFLSQKILEKIKRSKLDKVRNVYNLLNNKLIRNNTYQNVLFFEKQSSLCKNNKLEIYKFKIKKKYYKIVFLFENGKYSNLFFVAKISKIEFFNTEKDIFSDFVFRNY